MHPTLSDPQRQKPRETLEVLRSNAHTLKIDAGSIALHSIGACFTLRSLVVAWALDSATHGASRARFACASLHSSLTCLSRPPQKETQVFKPNSSSRSNRLRSHDVSRQMALAETWSAAASCFARLGRIPSPAYLTRRWFFSALRGFRNRSCSRTRACASRERLRPRMNSTRTTERIVGQAQHHNALCTVVSKKESTSIVSK